MRFSRWAAILVLAGGVVAGPSRAAATDPVVIAVPATGLISPRDVSIAESTGPSPFGGPGRVVRNVTQPSLTLFAPDPASATGAAMIIAPGGGFQFLSIDTEGEAVARWLASRGVTAFVLRYRLVPTPADPAAFRKQVLAVLAPGGLRNEATIVASGQAAADGLAAVRLVRSQAERWGIDPKKIGLLGFSAGGWVAASAGLRHGADDRPDLVATIYPVVMVAPVAPTDAPPLFVAAAADDPVLPGDTNLDLYSAWRKSRRSAELHVYSRGGHGFGMNRQKTTSDHWVDAFDDWLVAQGWIRSSTLDASAR